MPKLSFRTKGEICIFFFIIGLVSLSSPIVAFPTLPNPDAWSENLNLTPEQVQSLKEIKNRFRLEEVQIRKKIMMKRMELRTLTPEESRGEPGEELRRKIQALLFQGRERSLFYHQEALKVLTPEQQKKLPSDADLGFQCRMGFGRGGMGMGRGMGRGMRGYGTEHKTE